MPVPDDARQQILDMMEKKSKMKSKFYFKDFTKIFDDAKPREVKKVLTALVKEGIMEYWSSGSTTMYGLSGAGKQTAGEGES